MSIFGSAARSFLKRLWPPFYLRVFGSLNWVKSGIDSKAVKQVRALDLELFFVHRTSKNSVDYLRIFFQGHQDQLVNATGLCSKTTLIIALNVLSILVTGPTSSLTIILLSWDPAVPAACKVPDQQFPLSLGAYRSDHRCSPRMLGVSSPAVSHCVGEGCVS